MPAYAITYERLLNAVPPERGGPLASLRDLMAPAHSPPDVLVLAAGGILGEAWMSALLAGMQKAGAVDFSRTESLVGTSAGAIVAASLSAGRPLAVPGPAGPQQRQGSTGQGDVLARAAGSLGPQESLRRARPGARLRGSALRTATAAAGRVGQPLAPAALRLSAPGGAIARAAALAGVPEGSRALTGLVDELARVGARFDGRLRICCVDRRSGRRVVFGAPGAPEASVGQAVAASCAIPGVFRPVPIAGREYVDGGVWSPTNLDAVTVGRDTEVLCLNPMGSMPVDPRSPFGALRIALRAAEAVETAALRRRGARLHMVVPDAEAARAMGTRLMASAPRGRVARAGYRQGLELGRERATSGPALAAH